MRAIPEAAVSAVCLCVLAQYGDGVSTPRKSTQLAFIVSMFVGQAAFISLVAFGGAAIFSQKYHRSDVRLQTRKFVPEIAILCATVLCVVAAVWHENAHAVPIALLCAAPVVWCAARAVVAKKPSSHSRLNGASDEIASRVQRIAFSYGDDALTSSYDSCANDDLSASYNEGDSLISTIGAIVNGPDDTFTFRHSPNARTKRISQKFLEDIEFREGFKVYFAPFKFVFKHTIPRMTENASAVCALCAVCAYAIALSAVIAFGVQHLAKQTGVQSRLAAFLVMPILLNASDALEMVSAAKQQRVERALKTVLRRAAFGLQASLGLPWLVALAFAHAHAHAHLPGDENSSAQQSALAGEATPGRHLIAQIFMLLPALALMQVAITLENETLTRRLGVELILVYVFYCVAFAHLCA